MTFVCFWIVLMLQLCHNASADLQYWSLNQDLCHINTYIENFNELQRKEGLKFSNKILALSSKTQSWIMDRPLLADPYSSTVTVQQQRPIQKYISMVSPTPLKQHDEACFNLMSTKLVLYVVVLTTAIRVRGWLTNYA